MSSQNASELREKRSCTRSETTSPNGIAQTSPQLPPLESNRGQRLGERPVVPDAPLVEYEEHKRQGHERQPVLEFRFGVEKEIAQIEQKVDEGERRFALQPELALRFATSLRYTSSSE
jgi:hypothetical protein